MATPGDGDSSQVDQDSSDGAQQGSVMPWWKRNLAMPVLLVAMGLRLYGRLSTTTSEVLRQGEEPRLDDVMIASVPGSSDALLAVLETGGMLGSGGIPSLEVGSTRRKFGTSSFKPLESGFWLDAETARQLDTARRAAHGDEAVGVDLRLFASWQPLDEAMTFGASDLNSTSKFACPDDMAPYACLCANCPVRWSTVVYVIQKPDIAGCRTYGADWEQHAMSYLKADEATVVRYDADSDALVELRRDGDRHRILIVEDDDVRRSPGQTAGAVYSWILDAKFRARDDVDHRYFLVDVDAMRKRVRATLGDALPPFSGTHCEPKTVPSSELAAALGWDDTP